MTFEQAKQKAIDMGIYQCVDLSKLKGLTEVPPAYLNYGINAYLHHVSLDCEIVNPKEGAYTDQYIKTYGLPAKKHFEKKPVEVESGRPEQIVGVPIEYKNLIIPAAILTALYFLVK